MHETFINAIHEKKKIRLKFFSKQDRSILTRLCAPMDFGPGRRTKDQQPRYHLWDYESDAKNHTLSLLPDQIVSIEPTDEIFGPAEFITWDVKKSPWFLIRDWGAHS